ncbi:hypothetical protein [Streptomyces sp. NPDC093094]|uniref:hypothetical protein n=1 Tax=Streptomyces sp. NPDC093094 TaxID=3366026 RepID=UPI00380B3D69
MHAIAFCSGCGGVGHRLMRGGPSPLVRHLCRAYAAPGRSGPGSRLPAARDTPVRGVREGARLSAHALAEAG